MRPSLLFGSSVAIRDVLLRSELYAKTEEPILLLGEQGTGKTELANHIHTLSGRPGPFVGLSSVEVPDSLAHSVIGGHRRGAFTGAIQATDGVIESAAHGTLFIDELAEASPQFQTMLLHLLDRRAVRRLGEAGDRRFSARVIAATNADLSALIRAKEFRDDLRQRFGYFVLLLPPLRQRRADILPLARHFLAEFNKHETEIAPDAVRKLVLFPWPGNLRDLSNACRYASVHSLHGPRLTAAHLPVEIRDYVPPSTLSGREGKRRLARTVLDECGGNISEAARRLKMSRPTMYSLTKDDGDESASDGAM